MYSSLRGAGRGGLRVASANVITAGDGVGSSCWAVRVGEAVPRA